MTASICYVEKHFSKGVYIMQSLFGTVTMLLLSLSLGMGWRAFVMAGVCILTAFAGLSKKTLPIPFFTALLSAVIFHKKFLTSLAGLLNCVLTAHGKSAGAVEMLVEKSSDPWFALCVGAVIVSTVQSIFSRLDSRVFTVAMLALFLCAGIFIDIPLYYASAEAALGILALTFSGNIKGDLKPFVLIFTAFCAVFIACLTGLFDKLADYAFADRFNEKSEYEIIMEHPQPLYLIESRFEKETNGVWGELSGEEKYAYSDEFYWLDKLDFSPAFQTSSLDNALGISDSGIVTVNIKNGGKPIYTYGMTAAENAFSDPKIIGGSFENSKCYYRLAVSESYLTKPFGTFDTLHTSQPLDYLAAEKGYRDYVYSTCLDISAEDKQLAANHFDLEGSQGKLRSDMLSFFVSDTVLDRSKTYGGESSFADMLEVTCRGGEEDFAAAAVKIFRAKGIPARLCRGYFITSDMTKDLTDNSALTVTSKQLHYWAEYYKDGIGWQPFEVCPDYVGMIKTDDSSAKAKPANQGGEALAPEDEDKPREEIFEENKTKPVEKSYVIYIVIGGIVLILCLIAAIIALVRKRKFAALPDRKKMEKLFFAGRKKLCGKNFSDHTPRELFDRINKTYGTDMAESFAECEKIYEKARFSRLEISKEEMAAVKNFTGQAKKAKKLKGQEGAEK